MSKYILPFMLLSAAFGFSQDLNCNDFKTGQFRYTDPDFSTVIVTRDDKLQIERYQDTGEELHLYIDWTSECEYVLTFKKAVYVTPPKTKQKNMTGEEMFIKIVKIEGNKMTYSATFKGTEIKGDLIKILDN